MHNNNKKRAELYSRAPCRSLAITDTAAADADAVNSHTSLVSPLGTESWNRVSRSRSLVRVSSDRLVTCDCVRDGGCETIRAHGDAGAGALVLLTAAVGSFSGAA